MKPRRTREHQVDEECETLRLNQERAQLTAPCPMQVERAEGPEADRGRGNRLGRDCRRTVIRQVTLPERADNEALPT